MHLTGLCITQCLEIVSSQIRMYMEWRCALGDCTLLLFGSLLVTPVLLSYISSVMCSSSFKKNIFIDIQCIQRSKTFPSPQQETLHPVSTCSPNSSYPSALGNHTSSVSMIYLFWIFHITGITKYVTFCVQLLLLGIMFSSFIHIVAYISTFFLWPTNSPLFVLYHILFIYSSPNGHFGCFYLLVIVNSTAVNMCVHVFVWVPVFDSHGCVYLGVVLMAHMVNLCSTFWESAKLFSTAAVPFYISTSNYTRVPIFFTYSSTVIFYFSENRH